MNQRAQELHLARRVKSHTANLGRSFRRHGTVEQRAAMDATSFGRRRDKPAVSSGFQKPSDRLELLTPSLPCARRGERWQVDATVCRCFSIVRSARICDRLRPVATPRLHKCSIV